MKQPVYAPGTVIAGKYRIDKAIARGGCSIVYRGTHIDMQRPVALKIMTPDAGGDDASWTQRFQREAKLASQLRHPNTITTYDHGHDHGLWYIIMEWVEGASLRNVIRDQGPIEPERCANLTIQILKSLEEAHRAKILHRDMKPSNIMITHDVDGEEEFVKVLDFGLAKADPSQLGGDLLKLTRDGDFVGTPRYASPEQLKGRPLTNASDIYGVGMIMWEMLTGQPAVPQVDYAVCVEHHLGPRPWKLPPGQFPPGLSMVVEKALKKEPGERYASCREMRKALKNWLEISSGKGAQDFDLFEQIDSLGAGFESEMMGDALSEGVDMGADLFEDEVLAPTRKNPRQSAVKLRESEMFRGLDPATDPHEEMSEPEPDDSLLQAALGQSSSEPMLSPKRVTPHRQTGSYRRTNHGQMGEQPRSVTELQNSEIELDVHAMTHTSPRTKTPMGLHAPDLSTDVHARPGEGSKVIGVLLVLVLLVIGVGVAWKVLGNKPEERPAQSEGYAVQATTGQMAKESSSEALGQHVLSFITATDWEYERQPARVSIGQISQTAVRVKKGMMEVDLILYAAPDARSASDLEKQARAPTTAYRIGDLVIWMTPVGHLGEDAVRSLRKLLASYAASP